GARYDPLAVRRPTGLDFTRIPESVRAIRREHEHLAHRSHESKNIPARADRRVGVADDQRVTRPPPGETAQLAGDRTRGRVDVHDRARPIGPKLVDQGKVGRTAVPPDSPGADKYPLAVGKGTLRGPPGDEPGD